MTSGADWSAPGYAAVAQRVRERTGLVFRPDVRGEVETRIRSAMSARSIKDLQRYVRLLDSHESALDELAADLTVGETYFFREPEQLDYLRSTVLPDLIRRGGGERGPRVWSAGCASGEEAYSLAILLRQAGVHPASVIGTDISRSRLERARAGIYSRWSLRGLPESFVTEYFRLEGGRFRLIPEIRRAVEFRHLNLSEAGYPSLVSGIWEMDIVLCRNVLIYLDRETVAAVARRLMESLSRTGWLFLGASDPPLAELVPCEVVVTGAGVAYRRPANRPSAIRQTPPASPPGSGVETGAAPVASPAPAPPAPAPAAVAAKRGSDKPEDVVAEAYTCYAAREYDRAAELAGKELDRHGGDIELWALWIRALANRGDLREAGRACSAALDVHPTSAELMCLHALLLSAGGHHVEAATAARRALYLERDLAMAHLALGSALLRLGKRQAAHRALRAAERLLATLPPTAIVPASDEQSAARLLELARRQLALAEGA